MSVALLYLCGTAAAEHGGLASLVSYTASLGPEKKKDESRRAVSPPQPWAGAPPTSSSTVTIEDAIAAKKKIHEDYLKFDSRSGVLLSKFGGADWSSRAFRSVAATVFCKIRCSVCTSRRAMRWFRERNAAGMSSLGGG